jgi:hypothetical protein
MPEREMVGGFGEGSDLKQRGIFSFGYEYGKGKPVTLDFQCLPDTEGFRTLSSVTQPAPSIKDDSVEEGSIGEKRRTIACKRISFAMPAEEVGKFLNRTGLSETRKYDLNRAISAEYGFSGPDVAI